MNFIGHVNVIYVTHGVHITLLKNFNILGICWVKLFEDIILYLICYYTK